MADDPIDATRAWLERSVIGLNLCPFAKAVHVKRQIRFVATSVTDTDALLEVLIAELELLRAADPEHIDTTLIVHPHVLTDFEAYNAFLDVADAMLGALSLEGVLQIASFHPDYRFADAAPDDASNCTNRSPYPMLHLLREASVSRAVEAFPDPDAIVERNIEKLGALGIEGYARLLSR